MSPTIGPSWMWGMPARTLWGAIWLWKLTVRIQGLVWGQRGVSFHLSNSASHTFIVRGLVRGNEWDRDESDSLRGLHGPAMKCETLDSSSQSEVPGPAVSASASITLRDARSRDSSESETFWIRSPLGAGPAAHVLTRLQVILMQLKFANQWYRMSKRDSHMWWIATCDHWQTDGRKLAFHQDSVCITDPTVCIELSLTSF